MQENESLKKQVKFLKHYWLPNKVKLFTWLKLKQIPLFPLRRMFKFMKLCSCLAPSFCIDFKTCLFLQILDHLTKSTTNSEIQLLGRNNHFNTPSSLGCLKRDNGDIGISLHLGYVTLVIVIFILIKITNWSSY